MSHSVLVDAPDPSCMICGDDAMPNDVLCLFHLAESLTRRHLEAYRTQVA